MGHLIAFSTFVLGSLAGAPSLTAAPHSGGHLDSPFQVKIAWKLPERSPYAGETFPVTMEIAVPSEAGNAQLLQLFPQPLDLPLQLSGFEALASGRLIAVPDQERASQRAGQSVALDGEIAQAAGPLLSEGPDGRVALYSIKRWFKAPRSTSLELPGPGVRFAVATEFREDFVQGRVPVDRRTESASGAATMLEIQVLPEAGRPFEFTGAVGRFELASAAMPSTVAAGESMTLAVTIHPLGSTARPALAADSVTLTSSDAFSEQGRAITTDTAAGTQIISVSLVARTASVDALPVASLAYFDPGTASGVDSGFTTTGYQTATAPSPSFLVRQASPSDQVHAPSTPTDSEGDPDPDPDSGSDSGLVPEDRPIPYWTIGVGAFIFLLAVASVIRRHWPQSGPSADHDDQAQDA
ncbi:MAG: hypothetical protein ACI80K_002137 [Paracoccaceae bacterium]|jgi:hypothetical protein